MLVRAHLRFRRMHSALRPIGAHDLIQRAAGLVAGVNALRGELAEPHRHARVAVTAARPFDLGELRAVFGSKRRG
eukprot:14603768-Heterocapsa_arctica.AAC.1